MSSSKKLLCVRIVRAATMVKIIATVLLACVLQGLEALPQVDMTSDPIQACYVARSAEIADHAKRQTARTMEIARGLYNILSSSGGSETAIGATRVILGLEAEIPNKVREALANNNVEQFLGIVMQARKQIEDSKNTLKYEAISLQESDPAQSKAIGSTANNLETLLEESGAEGKGILEKYAKLCNTPNN